MKRAAQNILAIFAGDIASRAVGFLVTVYLARTLAPEGFGLVTIGLAVLGHLQLLTSPGFQVVETRNVAKLSAFDPDRLGGVFVVRSVLSAGALLLTALAVALFFPANLHCTGCARERCFIAAHGVVCRLGVAGERTICERKRRPLWRLCRLRADGTPSGAFSGRCCGCSARISWRGVRATALLLGVALMRTAGVPRFRWVPSMWKSILVENLPVGWAMFLGQMVINLPPLVIGMLLTTAGAGQYNAAMKLIFLILILDRVVNAVFLPAVTRMIVRNRSEAEKLIDIGLRVLLVAGIAAMICGILLAPYAIFGVFGGQYGEGIIVFQILLLYVTLTLLNSIVVCALVGAGGDRMYAGVITAGTIALVVFLLVLTPLFGIAGAAGCRCAWRGGNIAPDAESHRRGYRASPSRRVCPSAAGRRRLEWRLHGLPWRPARVPAAGAAMARIWCCHHPP